MSHKGVEYHPALKWLVLGEKRDKMEKLVQSLKRRNLLRNVELGASQQSLPLDIIAEMMEVTGAVK